MRNTEQKICVIKCDGSAAEKHFRIINMLFGAQNSCQTDGKAQRKTSQTEFAEKRCCCGLFMLSGLGGSRVSLRRCTHETFIHIDTHVISILILWYKVFMYVRSSSIISHQHQHQQHHRHRRQRHLPAFFNIDSLTGCYFACFRSIIFIFIDIHTL